MLLMTSGCTPAPLFEAFIPGLVVPALPALPAVGTEALAAAGLLPAAGFGVGFAPATGKYLSLKGQISILQTS